MNQRPRAEPLSLLIVEHDTADVELCIHTLQEGGFDVRADVVQDASNFAARLGAKSYDVILSDYRLPGWNGMEALKTLRQTRLDIPFILVTGTLGDERAVECIKAGADDYIIKQNLARLPVAVRRALGDKKLRGDHARSADLVRKLQLAVDQSPASVLITDIEGRIEYVNRRFTQVTGYTPEEALGRTPAILKSGRTPREVYAKLWSTIKRGNVWQSEVLNRRKSGDLFWDAISIAPIRDPNGNVTHFVGTQEDITDRKHAEQTLRDRHRLFQQLAENIQEVFFVSDVLFRETLYISPAYEQIWGRTCESAYADPSSFLNSVVPEDRERLVQDIVRTQKGEFPEATEFRVLRPDGTIRWVSGHAVPIRDERGEVYRISGTARDITERRQAQEALAISESRYRNLSEASFEGIAVSEGGVIREANRGFSQMFGYDLVEVIGRDVVDFVAEESIDNVTQRLVNHISGTYEFVGKRKDGREIVVEATAKTLDIGGRLERVTALRDITEKRLLETQFRQAQKMEAVGRLAGGVAHDFNNLLTVIISYAELLLRDVAPNEEMRPDLEQIRKAAEGAAVLTRQLLAFSRQQIVQPRPVRLEEVITAAENLMRRLVGEDVELQLKLNPAPSVVMVDPGQLEQVMLNLAANARDAMPTGGQLTVESSLVALDDEYVRLHYPATPGIYAVVAVSDTGVGMDKETQARIFEPFFTTKEIGRGTGLGLAMVYGIVKQSGGFIWVYSEPGKGSSFKLYFPVVDQHPTRIDAAQESGDVVGGTEAVLVVEDSAIVRSLAADILNRYGYRTLEALGSREALEIAASHEGAIDLVLTDVVMPELSGREVATRIVQLRPDARVLFMSGYAHDAVSRHGVLAAGTAYIQKPFTPSQLARKVREVLDSEPGPLLLGPE